MSWIGSSVLSPVLNASIDPVMQEYARVVAATDPSYETAKRLAARLDLQMRYEGADDAWATAGDLPTITEARREERGSFSGRHFYVAPAPNGGAYLFAWTFTERMQRAHLVIRNLLENAIKYSPPDSGAVEVSAAQDGECVVIRVTDDGPGIPEREMASLFEPFFRVDRSRSKKTGGYGLGLSITKRIVEAHGGTIAVENNAERGASFVVTLPKRATPAACSVAADDAATHDDHARQRRHAHG
jgi:signal transduction histidine kinase